MSREQSRGERRAWAVTVALAVTVLAGVIAFVWTGDPRFAWTAGILAVADLVAFIVGAAYAGRRTERGPGTIPTGPLTAAELARTEDD